MSNCQLSHSLLVIVSWTIGTVNFYFERSWFGEISLSFAMKLTYRLYKDSYCSNRVLPKI